MEANQTSHRQELADLYWDMYKEIHNIRPRWMNLDAMSIEELEAELDVLTREGELVFAREAEQQARAAAKFEEQIASMDVDRATALRWIMQAEDVDTLFDLMCVRNLPSNYFEEKHEAKESQST